MFLEDVSGHTLCAKDREVLFLTAMQHMATLGKAVKLRACQWLDFPAADAIPIAIEADPGEHLVSDEKVDNMYMKKIKKLARMKRKER